VVQNRSVDQVRTVTNSSSVTTSRRGGPMLFLRQVVAELRKVARPTRKELVTYTTVVLVFVLAVMTFVSILDFGFGKLVLWAFGGA
jgi:preprotein translocase subunit SecE